LYNAGLHNIEDIACSNSKEIFEIFINNESFQSTKMVDAKEIKARNEYLRILAEKVVGEAKVICVKEGRFIMNMESSAKRNKTDMTKEMEDNKEEAENDNYVKNSDMSDFSSDDKEENLDEEFDLLKDAESLHISENSLGNLFSEIENIAPNH